MRVKTFGLDTNLSLYVYTCLRSTWFNRKSSRLEGDVKQQHKQIFSVTLSVKNSLYHFMCSHTTIQSFYNTLHYMDLDKQTF